MSNFQFPYQRPEISELPANIQVLLAEARLAIQESYSPYSNFKVGAALLLENGEMLHAANHENAAYPAGICAERAVLGHLKMDAQHVVSAIAIAYQPANLAKTPPLAPCGICRQSILEVQLFQQKPIAVYMTSPDGQVLMLEDAAYLLPFHFSSAYL